MFVCMIGRQCITVDEPQYKGSGEVLRGAGMAQRGGKCCDRRMRAVCLYTAQPHLPHANNLPVRTCTDRKLRSAKSALLWLIFMSADIGAMWHAQHRLNVTGTIVRASVRDLDPALGFLRMGHLDSGLAYRPHELGFVLQVRP
ncbi:hypothetical protein ABPG75_007706 [Micractinium tetrahymenae]